MLTKKEDRRTINTHKNIPLFEKNNHTPLKAEDALSLLLEECRKDKENGIEWIYFSLSCHNGRVSSGNPFTVYFNRLETEKEYNNRLEAEKEQLVAKQLAALKKYEKLENDLKKMKIKLGLEKIIDNKDSK